MSLLNTVARAPNSRVQESQRKKKYLDRGTAHDSSRVAIFDVSLMGRLGVGLLVRRLVRFPFFSMFGFFYLRSFSPIEVFSSRLQVHSFFHRSFIDLY